MTEIVFFLAGFAVGYVVMFIRAVRAVDGAFDEIEASIERGIHR